MSNNSKTKQAFPGRTGMGYESGMSKLEYITTQLVSGALSNPNNFVGPTFVDSYIKFAQEIIKKCNVEETGQ